VATDLNSRFLVGHELPNLEVRRHDILVDDLEEAHYDLVHCRFVLMHLPDPLQALERMAAAVRPGGWLLVEEAAFGFSGATSPWHPRAGAFDRKSQVIRAAVQAKGVIDFFFGCRLPALVEGLGLREVDHEEATLIGRGGDPSARNCQMSSQIHRGPFVAAGVLTEADFNELDRAFDDPSFSFIPLTVFGAWGRRAG
jgi:SAM-dependent methyltransferase